MESQLILEREAFRETLAGYLNQFQQRCREYEAEIQQLQDQSINSSSGSSLCSTANSKSDGTQQYMATRMDQLLDQYCALAKKLDEIQTENHAADKRTHSLLVGFSEKMETILINVIDAKVPESSKSAQSGLGACPGVETVPRRSAAFLSTTPGDLTVSDSSSFVSFPPSHAKGSHNRDSLKQTEEVLAKLKRKCAAYFPFNQNQTRLESLEMALDLIIELEDKLECKTARNRVQRQESLRESHDECEEEFEKVNREDEENSNLEQHEEWKKKILERLSAVQDDLKEQQAENIVLKERLEGAFIMITQLDQEKSEKKAVVDAVSSRLDDTCQKMSEQSVQFNDRLSALSSKLEEISDSVDESLEQKCETLQSGLEGKMEQLQRTISQENLGRYVQLKTYESDEKSWLKAYESQRSCTAVQLDQMAQEIGKAVDLGQRTSTSQNALTGRLDVLCEKVSDISGVTLDYNHRLSGLSSTLDEKIDLVHETLEQKCADLQSLFQEGLQINSKANLKRFVQCKVYESDVKARNAACESQNQDITRQLQEMESKVKQKVDVSRNSASAQSALVEKVRSEVKILQQQMKHSLALAPRANAMLVKLSVSADQYLLGDIVFRLHWETVPELANEFYNMCVGEHGAYRLSGGDIFRVIPGNGIWFRPNGYVGKDCSSERALSIPAPCIPVRGTGYHSKAGLISVSMSGWPFCMITLGPAERLDGVNTVVGETVHGLEWIQYIERTYGSPKGDLKFELLITQCSGY